MKDIDIVFNNVIKLVEDGFTIQQSLQKLKFDRLKFYKSISKEQKVLLQMAKTSNTIYGIGSRWSLK
jgi:hypothetical protein